MTGRNRTRASNGRRRLIAITIVGTILAALVPALLGAPNQIQPGQRIDMKVLLVTASGTESSFDAWKAVLDRAGVVYDAKIADASPAFTDATFADYAARRSYYQAVILTDGDLVHESAPGVFETALAPSEWDALAKFQITFGIRQISDATLPGPAHGMNFATNVGAQDDNVGQLTDAGRLVVPELVGPVPIGVGSFGYQATPLNPATFTTLVSGPGGSSYLGVYTHPDSGREEMVMTVASSQFHLQNQLLRRGMLNWVTRGVFLGYERNYFTMHIDDVFAKDAAWDPVSNTTPGELVPPTCGGAAQPACVDHRMSPADVANTLGWQQANGLVFDMAYNGSGVQEARDENGGTDPLSDDPANGLLRPNVISRFRWLNHTWSHLQLDLAGFNALLSEITLNKDFATANGIPIDPSELVTGEHSGLGSYTAFGGNPLNPNTAPALAATGVSWVGDDNSAQPAQRQLPPPPAAAVAWTVPRHPSNVYFNVASRADQLDEYNHIYLPPPAGACVNTGVTTCRSTPATWTDYVGSEAAIMFDHLMGNDPRPHYAHQSNLMAPGGNGILFGADGQGVLDTLLARYRTYVDPALAPLVQPTTAQAGALLRQQELWRSRPASVSAYLQNGRVYVHTSSPTDVPVTGTTVGAAYAGQRSGWVTVNGTVEFTPANPSNVTPPTVSGSAIVGSTLSSGSGTWAGSAPIVTSLRWQRCAANGQSCVPIVDAGGPVSATTYTTSAADLGARIQVVQLAGNHVSSVSQAYSAMTEIVVAPSTQPPTNPPTNPPTTPPATPPATPPTNPPTTSSGQTAPPTAGLAGAGQASVVVVTAAPRLTALRMLPRRFAVTHTKPGPMRRPLGTFVTWRLSMPGTVTLTIERRAGQRWVRLGSVSRPAKSGPGSWRFLGRVGARRLAPGAYRLVARAVGNGVQSAPQRIAFTVARG
jgi:heparan sulfate-N-deacetylase